jgi:hypothetical protein
LQEKIVAESDPGLRRVERGSVIACAALALLAAVLARRLDAVLGVLGGGALVAISYRGVKAGISAAVSAAEGGSRASGRTAISLVKFFTRYAILAVAAYVIMARLRLPPVAVLAGASSLVIAVMVEALRAVVRPRAPGFPVNRGEGPREQTR